MLALADAERTRIFVMTDAEVKTIQSQASVVRESIFSYLNEKLSGVPHNIFDLDTYDHESGMLVAERLRTDSLTVWSSRLTEPDSGVPGRSWSVELTLWEINQRKYFGSRLSCFSRHLDFYFDPAVPRVYRELVSQGVLFGDGIKLSRTPIDVVSDDDVEWLVALLNNPKRQRNIIALSADGYGSCTLNPNIFADRLCGVAHVVRIYPGAGFKLSDSIGKYLSIFDSGVRIYRPTIQIETDDPLLHSLYTRHALSVMNLDRVQHSILSDAFLTSVQGLQRSRAIPTFAQIRSASATLKLYELEKNSNSSDLALLESQLKVSQDARMAAEAQAREALDLAVQEEGARKDAEDQRNQEKARAMVLAARLRSLESRLGANAETNIAPPDDYSEVPFWVAKEFAGRMKLHARALRGLKDATFNDINLVCKLLQYLAIDYVDSKRGERDAWKRFEAGTRSLGVEYSRSISENRAGEQGEEYYVRYKSERRFLEWHLKKGSSRDASRDLRIYFFWDEEDEEVIVGFLPGHLDNRIT